MKRQFLRLLLLFVAGLTLTAAPVRALPATTTLALPQTAVAVDAEVTVALTLSGNPGGVSAVDAVLHYDDALLDYVSAAAGEAASGWLFMANATPPGEVRLGLASGTAVASDGILARVTFRARGEAGQSSPLTLAAGSLNEGSLPSLLQSGEIKIGYGLQVGWNLLALNRTTAPMPTAQQMLDAIRSQGGDAAEIARWQNGGWDGHVDPLPFNDFTTEPGRGYFVRTSAPGVWVWEGELVASPITLTLAPGWNLVGLSRLPQPLKAEDLLNEIAAQGGACSEIDRWSQGAWVGHPRGYPVNNFDIRSHEGYFLKCSRASSYTPAIN